MRARPLLVAALLAPFVACVLPDAPEPPDEPELPPPTRVGYYVTPAGSPTGDGSAANPWDLATALDGPTAVNPGDTIWVRGGTYRGIFNSSLTGTAAAPIIVRAYPGERATLDGDGAQSGAVLDVDGAYTIFWGLEITDSKRDGTVTEVDAVNMLGLRTRAVNLVVHDVGGIGVGFWSSVQDGEVYGSIIYNNGYQDTDRGHGHGIYTQNGVGTKRIANNIIFNQFGYGIHAYTEGGQLSGFRIERNVAFNNGSLSLRRSERNLIMGGYKPVERLAVVGNVLYRSPGLGGMNAQLGYDTTTNRDVELRDNYIVGGSGLLRLWKWTQATVAGNEAHGTQEESDMLEVTGSLAGFTWANNVWRGNPDNTLWRAGTTWYTWPNWRQTTGLGATDRVEGTASSPRVFVHPNEYEAGRANVVVFNWPLQQAVAVDLSGVLRPGDAYEIRRAQNFFGAPVSSGTYGGGTVQIPMSAAAPPTVVGGSASPPPTTGPVFDVFVVLRRAS